MASLVRTTIISTIKHVRIKRSYSSAKLPQLETLAVSVPSKHVYHVELNRPKKLNAFNHEMWLELTRCFSELSDNPDCRVVVLSAQGKHFTAGIDFHSMLEHMGKTNEQNDVARKARIMYHLIELYQNAITSLETCVKPVLTLSHSACVGAGVDLITAADIRYCTSDSWFQVKEVDIGLAADVGTLQRLPKVIGNTSIARELCFTARKFDAEEALKIGLVSKVFGNKETALQEILQTADSIAKKSPVAVQVTKQNLVYSQSRNNDEGLLHIKLMNQTMLQSEDLVKAAMAQAQKEEMPEFDNL